MLKKIFLLIALSSTACGSKPVIAYVNPNKLMQGYHGATAQHEVFQAKAKVWQQRVDSLSTELQALGAAPTAIRAGREQQLLRYRDAVQQQAQQENERLTKSVLEEVNAYLKQYGKEKGYTYPEAVLRSARTARNDRRGRPKHSFGVHVLPTSEP